MMSSDKIMMRDNKIMMSEGEIMLSDIMLRSGEYIAAHSCPVFIK